MSGTARRSVGQRAQIAILAVLAAGAWTLAFYFRVAHDRGPTQRAPLASAQARATDGATGSPSAAATTGSAEPLSPSASPSASPIEQPSSASPAPSGSGAPASVTACVATLFPPATLERGQPDLSFICEQPYPRKAVTELQSKISLGQWGTTQATEGMREWAVLGWYELAALSLFRGHCCAATAPLEWTFKLACPLDVAMSALETAARAHDATAVDAAVQQYTKAATCLARLGQAPNFGQTAVPGPELSTFKKLVDRSRQAPQR
jgi:hypothetical protein